MLRVAVSASAAILNDPAWPEVASWIAYHATTMGTLNDPVHPSEVVLTVTPRGDDTTLSSVVLWVEVAACMTESLRVEGVLESCLRRLKENIERVVPERWINSDQVAVRIGCVPMVMVVF